MGYQIDISERVTVELRRESFILYVDGAEPIEYDYPDADALKSALFAVEKSERYLDHMGKRLGKWGHDFDQPIVFDEHRKAIASARAEARAQLLAHLEQNFLERLPKVVEHYATKLVKQEFRKAVADALADLTSRASEETT